MTWQPILTGELAGRAHAALVRIADDLAQLTSPAIDLALFWSYVAPVLGDAYDSHHERAIENLAVTLEGEIPSGALYGGLAGAGVTVAQCTAGTEELLAIVDDKLCEPFESGERWPGQFDLISGLVGIAVYFLERVDHRRARDGLAGIVAQLAAIAERDGDRIAWRTPPEHLPPRAKAPGGWYDCGLAHGVPGVLGILGRIAVLPDAPPAAAELRDGAIRWIQAQRGSDPERSRFPSTITSGRGIPSRTAWCYGDPGVALALWDAAARAGRSTAEAQAIARVAVHRPPAATGITDAMLCHGAAGLGHLCNRYFHASGDPIFREEASRWFTHALELQQPQGGIGGFFTDRHVLFPDAPWQADASFLDGAAGLGLALAAATNDVEPAWDRMMLCDLPLRA